MESRKAALQTAGFHSVTALSVNEGWTKINFFDISAVVIDHEFADDPRAKELGTHYLTLQLKADALPEQVALELVEQFGKGSETGAVTAPPNTLVENESKTVEAVS